MAASAMPAAAVDVTFTVTLSPDLARKLTAGGTLAAGPLAAYLERAARLVEEEATKRVPEDEGGLKQAMGHRVDAERAGGALAEIFNTSDHAVFVHGTDEDGYTWGRRPGAPPPPPDALAGWAERHGFSIEHGALFALARKIGEEGIKARPFLTDALTAKSPELEGPLLRQLAGDLERAWAR